MTRSAITILGALAFPLLACAAETPPTPKQLEFFEKKIRPLLTEHCYKCHSEDAVKANKLKGGLQVDTKAGLLAGGDSGPAIVPGKAAESLLLKSLKYTGDSNMPPAGKLPDAAIADVEAWIAMGAPDPRAGAVAKKQVGLSIEEGRKFWSYSPPAATPADSTIDSFILAKLTEKGLKPSAPADKGVLLRRIYFDLIGLPPTPEQVDAFVSDKDPQAYEKVVDRLLASPEFGERWGRHWLDIARFAESITLRGTIHKTTWRYRDYVIDTFNKDVPFDRFIREQIAGDLLPHNSPEERTRNVVATAFLVMGNTNLEEQDKKVLRMDVVDETLDVVTKGFLGQTVTCARCHDHKFDPIPTKDYYALAGIFRNTKPLIDSNVSNWIEVPLPAPPEVEKELAAHEAKVASLQARIKTAKATVAVKPQVAKGKLAIKDIRGIVVDDAAAKKVGEWTHSTTTPTFIGEGYVHDANKGKGEKSITFAPELEASGRYEVRLAYSPGKGRANNVPVTVFSADGEKELTIDMTVNPPLDGHYVNLGEYKFERKGQSFVLISNEGTKGHVTADAVVFVPIELKADPNKPGEPAKAVETVVEKDEVKVLEDELKKLQASGPKRPLTLSMQEETKIEDARIHIRGLVSNQGEVVPRGVLQVATTGKAPAFPKTQSGRVELAEWIASKDNPLTARVFANRVWHWLMGSGIVRTVDNFGTTGERPSHPELLDHLANRFVADGWSVKKLVRSIVLSQTYQQSSVANEALAKADPENQLFGRANKRRLDAEVIRDTLLTVSGKLATDRGGPHYPANTGADYNYYSNAKNVPNVRSVYLPVFRNSLPDVFDAFDFADPSMVSGKRNTSTVAPQALYFLNNPFPIEQAKASAARLLAEKHETTEARLVRAYRLTLGRLPTDGERSIGLRFVSAAKDPNEAWSALFQALFASADFRYAE
jgi:hypothetical protein